MAWEVNAVHAGSYIQERNWGNVERNNTDNFISTVCGDHVLDGPEMTTIAGTISLLSQLINEVDTGWYRQVPLCYSICVRMHSFWMGRLEKKKS